MGRLFAAAALTGWAAIVAVAWRLADRRIALCHFLDTPCIVRTTASRDYVLVAGLTVGLVAALLALALTALYRTRRYRELNGWAPANRAAIPLPRS